MHSLERKGVLNPLCAAHMQWAIKVIVFQTLVKFSFVTEVNGRQQRCWRTGSTAEMRKRRVAADTSFQHNFPLLLVESSKHSRWHFVLQGALLAKQRVRTWGRISGIWRLGWATEDFKKSVLQRTDRSASVSGWDGLNQGDICTNAMVAPYTRLQSDDLTRNCRVAEAHNDLCSFLLCCLGSSLIINKNNKCSA